MYRCLRSLYATESVERVKNELAASGTIPIDVLAELAFDGSEAVRLKVVENPRTPVALLICMAGDRSEIVQQRSAVTLVARST